MTRARANRPLNLSDAQVRRGKDKWLDWHWFNDGDAEAPEVKVVRWEDPEVPSTLIECGRLVRLQVRVPSKNPKHPRREKDHMIEFSRIVSENSHLAYDPEHDNERLYLLLAKHARPAVKQRFWNDNPMQAMDLNDLAVLAGGRHGKRDYPEIEVKPIGITTAVVYYTPKKSDGQSYYIHQLGELSHYYPVLACDETGRLWLAGGQYTCPRPGIKD
jgi:hypothetical protein